MTDYTDLDNAITAIRPANPKIAHAFDEVEAIVKTVAPPSSPPPPSSSAWAWDATAATLDPQSAAKITAFLGYSTLPTAYLECSVAVVEDGTSAYTLAHANCDHTVYAPPGVKAGASSDHHLCIRDKTHGRETDLWEAVPAATSIAVSGGCSFPYGAAQEPVPGNSNAARFPLARGIITPGDVASGVINHPLIFSPPASHIGGPCVYPANQVDSGPGSGLVFGQWLRLDSAASTVGLSTFDAAVVTALKKYGMFLRDGGSNFELYGQDAVNQGGNGSAYPAGFLPLQVAGYPYARQLAIPSSVWSHLQVLLPPTP